MNSVNLESRVAQSATPPLPNFDNDRALAALRNQVAEVQGAFCAQVAPVLAAIQRLAELEAAQRALQQAQAIDARNGGTLTAVLAEACPPFFDIQRDDQGPESGGVVLADLARLAAQLHGDLVSRLDELSV